MNSPTATPLSASPLCRTPQKSTLRGELMNAKHSWEIAEILAKYDLVPQNIPFLTSPRQESNKNTENTGKKGGLRDFSRTVSCPICNMKSSTKSGFLTHLTRLALSDQLDIMSRYKHAAIRLLFGQTFIKFDDIEVFMMTHKKAFLKANQRLEDQTSKSVFSVDPETSQDKQCQLSNTPEALKTDKREKEEPKAENNSQNNQSDDIEEFESSHSHMEMSQLHVLEQENLSQNSNISSDIISGTNEPEPTIQVTQKEQKIEEQSLQTDERDQQPQETDSHTNPINKDTQQSINDQVTEVSENIQQSITPIINSTSDENDNNVKPSPVEPLEVTDHEYKCFCGKVFSKEGEITRHASISANTEFKKKDYTNAIKHLELRQKYKFGSEQERKKSMNFLEQIQERMNMADASTESEPSEMKTVYTDGSGDTDASGTFRCGLGVYTSEGERLSFSLPGNTQTVIRAELLAILVALLITDKKHKVKIVTDSEIACNWFNKSRKTFTNMLDNKGLDNGDILELIVRASLHRAVNIVKVKAHTENKDADSLGNEEADKLANEGRLKAPQDVKDIMTWIDENGWNVPKYKVAFQKRNWDEETLPLIGFKSTTCEICNETFTTPAQKRDHVKSKHSEYLIKMHNLYSCEELKQETDQKVENISDIKQITQTRTEEINQEELTDIVFEKSINTSKMKFKKEGNTYKFVTELLQNKENETWSKHVENLIKLKEYIYTEMKEEKESQHKRLMEKYEERNRESNHRQTTSLDQYKKKLDEINLTIEALRSKMDNKSDDGSKKRNIVRKELRKFLAKRNKFTKRVESFGKKYKIKKTYAKDPNAALRLIHGNSCPKCSFLKEQLEDYFSHIYEKKERDETSCPSWWNNKNLFKELSEISRAELNGLITPKEVVEVVKKLPRKSTPGADGIDYKVWSMLPKHGDLLSKIFNTWLTNGTIPKEGCVAKVVLLHKKGDENEIRNWRPISLQQSLTKIFMKILQRRIIDALERDEIMSHMQKGFLRYNGCLEHVQSLIMATENARRHRRDIYGVFYDIENAFGSVPQDLIFKVLELHKFPKALISVIKSYYERDATVVVNGKIMTNILKQEIGVKQGCPLSPLLFILALDPMLRTIESECNGFIPKATKFEKNTIKYHGSAFADDLVLVSSIKRDLIKMHKILAEYMRFTGMKIGISKSSAFGRIQKNGGLINSPPNIKLNNEAIPTMKSGDIYNYLGVSITPNTGKSIKRKKCEDRISNIVQLIQRTTDAGLSPWQLQHCIKTFYIPTLVYSIGQLDLKVKELRKVDTLIRKTIKTSLGIPNSSSSDFIHCHNNVGGLGMPELCAEKDIFTISTWYQLLTSKDPTVKGLAWKEFEDYANKAKVPQKKDAEYDINSGNCQHFLNWCTRDDGVALRKETSGANRRVSSLLRALAKLGCSIKKDKENHLQLLVGTIPINGNITQTLRGVYRTRRAANWVDEESGQHMNLAQKAREGNWWISRQDFITEKDYRFVCKVRVNALPCPTNRVKWKEDISKKCPLCNHPNCTQQHILSGCPTLLPQYQKRHDHMVKAMKKMLEDNCYSTVFREKTLPNSTLRPDLTVPEGKARGVFLDVGVTASDLFNVGIPHVFRDKYKKYGNKKGIRMDGDKENVSKETFRFVPLLFTSTGLYKPSLFRDLVNTFKMKPKTAQYMLRRLSALSIKGSRFVWMTYARAAAAIKNRN